MDEKIIKTAVDVKTLHDLVRLRIFLPQLHKEPSFYLFLLPKTPNKEEGWVFFFEPYNLLQQGLLVYYRFFAEDLPKAKAIEYDMGDNEINLAEKSFKDPSLRYLPLFELTELSTNVSPLVDDERSPFRETIQSPSIDYWRGRTFSDVIRIAEDLEHIVFALEQEETAFYITGFPNSLFPAKDERTAMNPLFWAEAHLPRKDSKNPAFVSVSKEGVEFLLGKAEVGKSAPLVHVNKFPFPLPGGS